MATTPELTAAIKAGQRGEATVKQQRILAFMRSFHREHRVWPTLRETLDRFGYKSPNTVRCHLQRMEHKGLVHRVGKGVMRGYVALDPADAPRCECCGQVLPESPPQEKE